jgi:ribonuclease Y
MFDVLATLSGLVREKKTQPTAAKSQPVKPQQQKPKPPQASPVAAPDVKLAEAAAREILLTAKDEAMRIRKAAEDEMRRKDEDLSRRSGALDEREKRLTSAEEAKSNAIAEVEELKKQTLVKLEKVAHLTRDEAKEQILGDLKESLREDIAREIKTATAQATDEAEVKAREILVDAMKHGATDYVAEFTVSIIKVTDEDVKGRIIGQAGRNIRAFETESGVDVDLDEAGVIRLSSFDPVRREIARVALERLIKDSRIQPARIEEILAQVKKETERIMFEEGQKLCHAVGVYNLPPPLIALLGRFKYRSSYGQNMIAHTLEETKIGIALAQEIGADVNVVRLGCLLHDIGKVIMDKEGNHVELGVEVLRKYGMPSKVTDCVAQHHEDTPFTSPESVLVYISDAISGSRPGARYEDYEGYVKRLKDLEEIAKSHKGVKESFAFQAGRELRVMVDPGEIDDAAAVVMAREIRDEVAKKVVVPGQVKVIVIRELRATEIVK